MVAWRSKALWIVSWKISAINEKGEIQPLKTKGTVRFYEHSCEQGNFFLFVRADKKVLMRPARSTRRSQINVVGIENNDIILCDMWQSDRATPLFDGKEHITFADDLTNQSLVAETKRKDAQWCDYCLLKVPSECYYKRNVW